MDQYQLATLPTLYEDAGQRHDKITFSFLFLAQILQVSYHHSSDVERRVFHEATIIRVDDHVLQCIQDRPRGATAA